MEGLRLEDVHRALDARDPSLVDMVVSMANRHDTHPDDVPEGAFTIWDFRSEVKSWGFRYKSEEEKMHYRVESWKRLESDDAEVPLPDRYQLHEIIMALYEAEGAYARETLLELIRRVPFTWGVWRAIKALFKETEKNGDIELFGALVARVDSQMSNTWGDWGEVTRRTMTYLSRRAWRFLRTRGENFPAAYVDTACAVLREYDDNINWGRAWVVNHILFHNYKHYGRRCYGQSTFRFWRPPDDLTEHRAFSELWRESPRALFSLLERARSEKVRQFAIEGLKADFRAELRELDAEDIVRLIQVDSATVHDFAVWLLENAPRFEQAAFRELGLHEAVLSLFESPSYGARAYVSKYARTHARDLPLETLVRLANHADATVREVVGDLLRDRDPRREVGLDAWGELLGTTYAHEMAVEMLREHFGASELTPDWFRPRFLSDQWNVVQFAVERFADVHKTESVGVDYYLELLDAETIQSTAASFVVGCLERFDFADFDADVFRRLLLHPQVSSHARNWLEHGKVEPGSLGEDYWKALAFEPSWNESSWVGALLTEGPPWARGYRWNQQYVAAFARSVLGDVRNYSPTEVGLDWLMRLVERSEDEYRDWATGYMYESFAPAEFAEDTDAAPGEADLAQKSFLFTGKLSSMTRKEAQAKVTGANGTNAKSVTESLDYLVIGDEGSPLYGEGSKGSKQTKAESLNESGAAIGIISETAFMQMLSGTRPTYTTEQTIAGCERLWGMATGEGEADAPVPRFAREYLRRHHDALGERLSERAVDPSRAIPREFLTFERISALFSDSRIAVRRFALDLARWEMARWAPDLDVIVEFCENERADVRTLFSAALLADDTPDNARFRIPPEKMDVDGVYQFCESLDRGTRSIGMALIDLYPQFAVPESLFRLTESPDRRVRGFVIRTMWSLYRRRAITTDWEPRELDPKYVDRVEGRWERGTGATEAPDEPPATPDALRGFLRRILFGIPPARLPKDVERTDVESRPLPARRGKLYLMEVMRDLALEDSAFAEVTAPLFREFVRTRGKSERGACLVALARLDERWPDIHALAGIAAEEEIQ